MRAAFSYVSDRPGLAGEGLGPILREGRGEGGGGGLGHVGRRNGSVGRGRTREDEALRPWDPEIHNRSSSLSIPSVRESGGPVMPILRCLASTKGAVLTRVSGGRQRRVSSLENWLAVCRD